MFPLLREIGFVVGVVLWGGSGVFAFIVLHLRGGWTRGRALKAAFLTVALLAIAGYLIALTARATGIVPSWQALMFGWSWPMVLVALLTIKFLHWYTRPANAIE